MLSSRLPFSGASRALVSAMSVSRVAPSSFSSALSSSFSSSSSFSLLKASPFSPLQSSFHHLPRKSLSFPRPLRSSFPSSSSSSRLVFTSPSFNRTFVTSRFKSLFSSSFPSSSSSFSPSRWFSQVRGYRPGWDRAPPSFFDLKPVVTYAIIGANVGIFFLWDYSKSNRADNSFGRWMYTHFMTSYSHLQHHLYHTLVTHSFSHMSGFHLLSNLIGIFYFGSSLERFLGRSRFFALYLAAGLVGGALQVYFDNQRPSLGASGSVMSLVVLNALISPSSKVLIYGIIPVPLWGFGFLIVGQDLWQVYREGSGSGGSSNVGYMAHLGGAATGLAYWLVLRRPRVHRM